MSEPAPSHEIIRAEDDIRSVAKSQPKYAQNEDRPYEGDPWSRQPRESARAYSAFCFYRDLGDTRTRVAADKLYREKYGLTPMPEGKRSQVCYEYSRKHRWKERVTAYDNFMDAKLIAENKRRAIRVSRKHADQAAAVQEVVMLPIEQLRKRIEEQGGELAIVNELGDAELMKLFRALGGAGELTVAQRAERDALSSAADVHVDPVQIKARGEKVRAMLANPDMVALFEKVTFSIGAAGEETSESS